MHSEHVSSMIFTSYVIVLMEQSPGAFKNCPETYIHHSNFKIVGKYPFFAQLYRDIINFRFHPKELISMFSEALLTADRNTVNLMIDEMRQELSEKDAALSEKDAEIQRLKDIIQRQAYGKSTP